MSTESSRLNGLDEKGQYYWITCFVTCKAGSRYAIRFHLWVPNIVQYYLQNLRYSQRTVRTGGRMRCDIITLQHDPERRHILWSGHISVQLNEHQLDSSTVAYVSLQYYFPTFISVGRHRSHKTIVNNIYVLKDQLLTVPKFRQLPAVIGGESKLQCFFPAQLQYSFTQISDICN